MNLILARVALKRTKMTQIKVSRICMQSQTRFYSIFSIFQNVTHDRYVPLKTLIFLLLGNVLYR